MVCCRYVHRVVYYLSRFEYLRYRYKICNPMPEIINNTPKATNDTSELAFEIIMHKTPHQNLIKFVSRPNTEVRSQSVVIRRRLYMPVTSSA